MVFNKHSIIKDKKPNKNMTIWDQIKSILWTWLDFFTANKYVILFSVGGVLGYVAYSMPRIPLRPIIAVVGFLIILGLVAVMGIMSYKKMILKRKLFLKAKYRFEEQASAEEKTSERESDVVAI